MCSHPELIHDIIHIAGILLTVFVGSGWYKTHTNLVQRAYLSVLWKETYKFLQRNDPIIYPDSTQQIAARVVQTVDTKASAHPAIKAALDGDNTQLHADIAAAVKKHYQDHGPTTKGG